MTREEAKAILENDIVDGHVEGNARFMDAFWMAVDALSQEPTRDIEKSNFSQEQYLLDTDTAYKIGYEQGKSEAQKSGKWIDKEISNPDYPFQDRKIIECSKCHYGIVQARLGYTNYCPNCGAKMVEPQEFSQG